MNFIAQSFKITLFNAHIKETKQVSVNGYIAEGTGPGYHYDAEEEIYVTTHLPGGYSVGYWLYDETHVQAWIEALVPLWDWQHMSAKDMFALPKAKQRKVSKALHSITDDYSIANRYLTKEVRDMARAYAE